MIAQHHTVATHAINVIAAMVARRLMYATPVTHHAIHATIVHRHIHAITVTHVVIVNMHAI